MDPIELQDEIRRRRDRDQQVRSRRIGRGAELGLLEEQENVDAENLAWMRAVIDSVGWPAYSLVGKECGDSFWLLVQYADADVLFQDRCLTLLEDAVDAGEADPSSLAYLTDRVRLGQGRPQVYGTQCNALDGRWVPRPLEDAAGVDDRRSKVGLPPLAEYLAQMEAVRRRHNAPQPPRVAGNAVEQSGALVSAALVPIRSSAAGGSPRR